MKITVSIPTYRSGAMLRSALASVQNQSLRSAIAEVIVSENSDDPGSATVAREFPDLPSRHVVQSPPTDPATHFTLVVDLAISEWVAVLRPTTCGETAHWIRERAPWPPAVITLGTVGSLSRFA
jgi:hypothetical protein